MVLTGGSSKLVAQLRYLARALPPLIEAPEQPTQALTRRTQRRLAADQAAQLVAEYQAGADMKDLATRWGVHRTTVAGHLRRAGVDLRRQGLSDEQLNTSPSQEIGRAHV